MDILLNELSLSGQHASREIFVEEILPTLIGVLDEIQELFKATIYKNQQFYSSRVTRTDTIHDILVGDFSRQYPSLRKIKRQFFSPLFAEPYWEDTRMHSEDYSYTYAGNDICNHSVAEACERDKVIISFIGTELFREETLSILKNGNEQIGIDNLFNAGHYSNVLHQRGIIYSFSLKDGSRFQKNGRIVQGQNVYREIETGYYWYLDNLHKNHYEVFDRNGQHIGTANTDGVIDPSKRVNGRTLQ
ncbi:hypothetical protein [Bacteroides heparinolyticus]|uniref:hypothetical protein n=1 Tax=Prevotella heparinolytica TaxID=28113 RepID=UPI0023F15771|nr:hypothetical protein [Bacteroides heparinolyticus]